MTPPRGAGVAIVGGGPAGSTAAIRLADLGYAVTLVERQSFPRDHVGEALSPGVAAQLDHLGLATLLDRCGGARSAAAAIRWGGDWQVRPAPPRAVTVDRGRFDAALLDAARARGVQVVQPFRATAAAFEGEWRVRLEGAGGRRELRADFLIDASGRAGFNGRRRRRSGPRTVAVHALWGDTGAGGPRIAALPDGWIWASPIPGLGDRVILFADPAILPRDAAGLEAFYRDRVGAGIVCASGRPSTPLRVCDAGTYCDEQLARQAFLRIGEAAYALDPLSSSGVQKAISTGLSSAIIVNTILCRPRDTAQARHFYEEEVRRTAERHARWSAGVYAANPAHAREAFWATRSGPLAEAPPVKLPLDGILCLSNEARIVTVPVLKDAFVEFEEALVAPGLDRPLAYFDGAEVAVLVRSLRGTPGDIERRFRRLLSPSASRALLIRLAACGVLVSAAPSDAHAVPIEEAV